MVSYVTPKRIVIAFSPINKVVHSTHLFLGASLDGILTRVTPIRVKAFHYLPENKTIVDEQTIVDSSNEKPCQREPS